MLRFFILILSSAMMSFAVLAADKTSQFQHEGVARDAGRYEAWLQKAYKRTPRNTTTRKLFFEGRRILNGGQDPRGAARNFARVVTIEANHARGWLLLAQSLLTIPKDQQKGSENYSIPVNASGAAYLAYQRATREQTKAAALSILAQALVRRSYWRPALDAYKKSLQLDDTPKVRQAYQQLRAERGFRITNYRVENETTSPRLCIEFSETLKDGEIDFAKYISVNGKDPENVNAEGQNLCIDGFKHGRRFEVDVRAGLPARIDDQLHKNSQLTVYVRDRSPTVRFTGRGYVLPSRGQSGIPVVSINAEQIAFKIYRIGDRGLVGAVTGGTVGNKLRSWDLRELKQRTGQQLFAGKLTVKKDLNKEITTAIPVSKALPKMRPGVYAISASAAGAKTDGEDLATQWFVVSDLGLTSLNGRDGIHVFVRSLESAGPVAKASVKLVARNNEVLGTANTDERGYARFDGALGNGEGGLAPAVLVAEGPKGDYSYLDVSQAAFDLTDRGVKGRDAPGPIDAYMYTERGVYRPGEEVNVTSLVRDRKAAAASVPVTMVVLRPDGVEDARHSLKDQGLGGRFRTLYLSPSAMTGTWRVNLHTDVKDDPVATAGFLVEDFVPERLSMELKPAGKSLKPGVPGTVNLTGKFLYGPPAADLDLEGEVIVRAGRKEVAAFPGFKFGHSDERIDPVREPLQGVGRTNAQGLAEVPVQLPKIKKTARPLEAQVVIRMIEPGGRSIERSIKLPVQATIPRIGIKPQFDGQSLSDGAEAAFDVVGLDAGGKQTAIRGLTWELVRLERNWQWYKRDGTWAYDAVKISRKVADGKLDTRPDGLVRIAAPVGWGQYKLTIQSDDPEGPASSLNFTAGWYTTSENDSPEMLAVALDKDSYRAGEKAKLRITSKHGGKALINVVGHDLVKSFEADIQKGDAEVEIDVGKDWGAGAYVLATLYRAMDIKEKRMPERALGVTWLGIDTSPRTLQLEFDVPDKVRSASNLVVPVKVKGLIPGESARITIAAVDVGVLNLTRFKSPAPETWFYAQRLLGTEYRDLYGRLIDGMRAERGALKFGGDGAGSGIEGSPPVEDTLSLFSGIVAVKDDGTAQVTFELPNFNGTVRIMAVAWSGDKVGHGTRDVIVRDPVTLTASGPRFLTLGDKARLQLDIHNVEGATADYKVSVVRQASSKATGNEVGKANSVFDTTVKVEAGKRIAQRFEISPKTLGLVSYNVRVTDGDSIDVKRELVFDVKAPARDVRRVTVSKLEAGGGQITLSKDLLVDMLPGRTSVSLSVGPLAKINVPALLSQLDRYPYGCAEQTTSKALPLLYASAFGNKSLPISNSETNTRIGKAIAHLFTMQDSSGAFGVWGPGNADMWLTSYVTDFLGRAASAGHKVDQRKFQNALDRLQNFVSYVADFKRGGQDRAYALYVLARNGRAPIGELRYYADTRLERFATPLAKAQLGAALAMMGDKERSQRSFDAAIADLGEMTVTGLREDYGSGIRDGAAVLTLASESRLLQAQQTRLGDVLSEAFAARQYTSTQEQAWMLLAANAMQQQQASTELSVDGKAHKGLLRRQLKAARLQQGQLVIANSGQEAVDAVVSVIGTALTPEPAIARGFTISRTYYTLDGQLIDMKSAEGSQSQISQNDRMVVVLKIASEDKRGRVLLVDRLPAGLEIENPRLVSGGDISALSWIKSNVAAEHTEFRDDRFVAAFNFFRNGGKHKSATVAYIVRAVTPGSFVHPAALVEDMYQPEKFARTASGRLEIVPRSN
ncbi:MAG: alpha-2-macroglobulin [Pseudomonadota bacterium]